MKRALSLLGLALGLLSTNALATGPVGVGTPVEAAPPPTTGLEPGNKRQYWAAAPVGLFASSIVDAGYIYLRPQIALGWGRPHWHFLQAESFATVSAGGLAHYSGLRVSLPHLEARSGMRYQFSYTRSFYERPAENEYNRSSLESQVGPSSRYWAWDSELLLSAPLLHGSVFGLFGAYNLMGVPDGFDVYEEMLRVMARPHWLFRGRLGHVFRLGEQGAVRVGPVVEMILNPARNARVLRAGLIATIVLTHHLEILATFIPTITSPDRIGLAGGDFAQLGVRYRWGYPEKPPADPVPTTLTQP